MVEVKNIKEPTRFFEVGEEIVFKNDHKYKILEKHESGKFYLIESEPVCFILYGVICINRILTYQMILFIKIICFYLTFVTLRFIL
jgi:hypothetical protein